MSSRSAFAPITPSSVRGDRDERLLQEEEAGEGEAKIERPEDRVVVWRRLFLMRVGVATTIPVVIGLLLLLIGLFSSPCLGYHFDGAYYQYQCFHNTTCCQLPCSSTSTNVCVNGGSVKGFIVGGSIVIICGFLTGILYSAILCRRRKTVLHQRGNIRHIM